MALNPSGAFAYSSPTAATGAAAGNVIASANWNTIHTDLQTAMTVVATQVINSQTTSRNLAWGNGGFEIWQRGAGSSYTSGLIGATTQYVADRWYITIPASVSLTITANAGIDTPNQSVLALKAIRNSGNVILATSTTAILAYPFDTEQCFVARGAQLALQFWVKPGANFNPGVVTATVYAGTGATAKRTAVAYTNEQVLLNANVTVTAGGASRLITAILGGVTASATTSQMELQLSWAYSTVAAGADDSVYFDNVELEVQSNLLAGVGGTYAMGAFDHIPFGLSMVDCRQHYQKTFSYNVLPAQNTANYGGALPAISPAIGARVSYLWRYVGAGGMRNTPAITTYAPGGASANWWDVTAATSVGVFVTATSSIAVFFYSSVSTTLNDFIYIHAQADAGI